MWEDIAKAKGREGGRDFFVLMKNDITWRRMERSGTTALKRSTSDKSCRKRWVFFAVGNVAPQKKAHVVAYY
jgi:hypothetical protein